MTAYNSNDSKAKLKEEYIKSAQANLDSFVSQRIKNTMQGESLDKTVKQYEEHLKQIQDMDYEAIKKLNFRGIDSY